MTHELCRLCMWRGCCLYDLWFTWHPNDAKSMGKSVAQLKVFEEGPCPKGNPINTHCESDVPGRTTTTCRRSTNELLLQFLSTQLPLSLSLSVSSLSLPFSVGNFSLSAHWLCPPLAPTLTEKLQFSHVLPIKWNDYNAISTHKWNLFATQSASNDIYMVWECIYHI